MPSVNLLPADPSSTDRLRITFKLDESEEGQITHFYSRRATLESRIRLLAFVLGLLIGGGSAFMTTIWLTR